MRRTLLHLVVVAGALVASATGASGQDPPGGTGLGIRLTEAPASAGDDPRARTSVVDQVEAGDSFSRRLQIRNDSPQPMDVDNYVAGATISDGGFTIGKAGEARDNPLTTWAMMQPASVRLDPGQVADVTLRVSVPASAEDGEYYGAAVAAIRGGGGDVQLENRVAIRLFLAVGDDPLTSDFRITRLQASRGADGVPVVTASVRNTGERALAMSGELELEDGPGGTRAGPFPAELGRTLGIGETQPVRVVLDEETPAGPWKATLTLRSGRIERAVEGTIRFPAAGEASRFIPFRDAETERGIPAAIAGSLLFLVLIALLLLFLRGRRKGDEATG